MKQRKLRFILALGALMVFGFMITSLTSYYAAHDTLSEQISENALPLTSNNIYSEIQRDLLQPVFISSLMAQDTFVRDWALSGERNPEQVIKYLNEIQKRYATITSFFIPARTLLYYHPSGIIKTLHPDDPRDKWYFDFIKSKKEYEINLDFDTANPYRLTVFINYRAYDYQGNLIGVTGVGLGLSDLKERINNYQNRYGRTISFVDREGRFMLSTAEKYQDMTIRDIEGLKTNATALLSSPSGSYSYQRNGKTYHLNARLIDEFQWYLLVEQEENLVEEQIVNNLISNLAISFAICIVIVLLANVTINRYQSRLEEMATTDNLTGVNNRHVFDAVFAQVRKMAQRHEQDLTLAMLDIDHFKDINDSFGHVAGDMVLRSAATILQERLRNSDILFRWGGEEFLIIFPDCDANHAAKICEDIRQLFEERRIVHDTHKIRITASIGITQMQHDENEQSVLHRVDKALYRAKESGRNQVCLSETV